MNCDTKLEEEDSVKSSQETDSTAEPYKRVGKISGIDHGLVLNKRVCCFCVHMYNTCTTNSKSTQKRKAHRKLSTDLGIYQSRVFLILWQVLTGFCAAGYKT